MSPGPFSPTLCSSPWPSIVIYCYNKLFYKVIKVMVPFLGAVHCCVTQALSGRKTFDLHWHAAS